MCTGGTETDAAATLNQKAGQLRNKPLLSPGTQQWPGHRRGGNCNDAFREEGEI